MPLDSDDGEGLLTPALPIGNFNPATFDPSIPPSTAQEYLHRVMWEAKQCDEVVTVKLNENKVRSQGPLVKKIQKMKAPIEYIPPTEVKNQFLAQFSHLREKIEVCRERKNIPSPPISLPDATLMTEWNNLCFGNEQERISLLKNGKAEDELPELVEARQPLLSILLNISPITLENLIEWHGNRLEEFGFSELQGRWLFSLLACLQKPLTPETCSVVRNIVQNSALIRASLDSAHHPHLIHLNMLITIITKYFGQEDLADSQ